MLPLSFTRMPFGKYLDEPFDAIPLSYLDWLSGQDWLYGDLRKRLTRYLNKPCIQQELEALFPDPDDDSRKPAFTVASTYTRREPMPKADDEPRDWQPTLLRRFQAWELAADILQAIEDAECVEDLPEWDHTDQMRRLLPAQAIQQLEAAYRQKRDNLQLITLLPPWKREAALLLLEAIEAKPELRQIAEQEAPDLLAAAELAAMS